MLVILSTHPIQYQVPLWRALARDAGFPFEVWYLTDHGTTVSRDEEFGRSFAWDVDLLSGYRYRFLNVAIGATPGSFYGCRLTERLSDRLRSAGARVLWVQGWQVYAYWQAVWQAKGAGVEVWLRGESNDLQPVPLWKRGVKQLALREYFRHVDQFLCIGSANRRLYKLYGVADDRLHSAPYAVDNDWFAHQAEELRPHRSEIRRQWGIPENAFCILFCGKFIPKKRPLDVIGAVRLLQERLPLGDSSQVPGRPWHLLFAGSGQLGGTMRGQCDVVSDAEGSATELGAAPPATFTGFLNQTEIPQAYAAADCLVLPSDYGETWGLVVNEASASGVPCIVSSACGCAEDMSSCGLARVYPMGDIGALGRLLQNMSDAHARGGLGEAVAGRFSIEHTAATVRRLALRARLDLKPRAS